MTHGVSLWLSAEPGSSLPPGCYASVVHPQGKDEPSPLASCSPDIATHIGDVEQDCGCVLVDIFQKVGTIEIGSLSAQSSVQATVAWPGQLDLCIQVAVLDQADRPIQGESFDKQQVTLNPPPRLALGSLGKALSLSDAKEEAIEFVKSIENVEDEAISPTSPKNWKDDSILPMSPASCKEDAVLTTTPTSRKARDKRPDSEKQEDRAYMPIVLNNCDQIIPNLYLGGIEAVADSHRVSSQGIKAICCCLREMEYPSSEFCKDVEYYRVDVEDMGHEPIELFFPEATEFIHSWISREQPVLVHCRAGVSRSASVVIAYLMTYHSYSLHEAFFVVRSHRSVATPNIGFMEKLCDFEEDHRSCSPTIDVNKYESWYTSAERGAVPDLIPD